MAQAAMASTGPPPVGSSSAAPSTAPTPTSTPTPGLQAPVCPDLVPYPYDATHAALFAFCAAAGLFYTLVGYRFFKTTMFLTGAIFGSCLVYNICIQGDLMPYYGNAGVSLAAGILFGVITVLLRQVGLFLTGFLSGLLIAISAVVAISYFALLNLTTMKVGATLLASAIFCALLNLYFSRVLTIINTCICGAALGCVAADFFVENLWMTSWVRDKVALRRVVDSQDVEPCWFSWLMLGAWPALTLVCILVQLCMTAHGVRHGATPSNNKARGPQPQRPRTREQRAELRQNKYRYLYQVRTAHGDVITQALPRKNCPSSGNTTPGMEAFNTMQSDSSTHITSIPPDATALSALTESEDDLIQLDRGGDHGRHHRNLRHDHFDFGSQGGHSAGGHSGGGSVNGGHGRRSPYR